VIEIALNGGSEKEKREENTEARRAFVEVETVLDGDRGGGYNRSVSRPSPDRFPQWVN
jgi:hypothetical protein